jgi:Flp pilus assembly pilin Flp
MQTLAAARKVFQRVHRDERGAVSLETVLIIGAIAIPILIFIVKYGWPKIRNYFDQGIQQLQGETNKVTNGN